MGKSELSEVNVMSSTWDKRLDPCPVIICQLSICQLKNLSVFKGQTKVHSGFSPSSCTEQAQKWLQHLLFQLVRKPSTSLTVEMFHQISVMTPSEKEQKKNRSSSLEIARPCIKTCRVTKTATIACLGAARRHCVTLGLMVFHVEGCTLH